MVVGPVKSVNKEEVERERRERKKERKEKEKMGGRNGNGGGGFEREFNGWRPKENCLTADLCPFSTRVLTSYTYHFHYHTPLLHFFFYFREFFINYV